MSTSAPSILCPIDFSEASRGALRYAGAIAEHVGGRLIVLTVDDPLLTSVAAQAGLTSMADESRRELHHAIDEAFTDAPPVARTLDVRVAVGKPAEEILRVAREQDVELLVMSSHGRSGVSKHFFGSTTERVLRSTDVPVLVTPAGAGGGASLADVARHVHRIIVPVDLSGASPHQLRVAAGIGKALGLPLIVTHVLEPVAVPPRIRRLLAGTDAERRVDAETRLGELAASVTDGTPVETLPLVGDPPQEIVKLADARDGGLIVMGLHSSGLLGPRMGAVTYRVLCTTKSLVLALPPVPDAAPDRAGFERIVICL